MDEMEIRESAERRNKLMGKGQIVSGDSFLRDVGVI